MTDQTAPQSSTEASVIEGLVRSLAKGLRAVQIYLPNNPVYEQATNNLRNTFQTVWRQFDEVEIEVADTEMRWDDHVVYSQPTKQESVAWLLFKDGIRSMTFNPGVEDGEVVRFLTVLNRVRTMPPDAEDDLLTLLWEEEFEHLRYAFVEVGDEEGLPLEPGQTEPEPAEVVREHVQREVAAQAEKEVDTVSVDFDSTLYELAEDELAYLQRELVREYDQDLHANVLAILFDIYERQSAADVRTEIHAILRNFLGQLVGGGAIAPLTYLLREAQVVAERATDQTPDQRTALEDLPTALSDPATFLKLLALIEGGSELPSEAFGLLVRALQPETFAAGLDQLPRVQNAQTASMLETALLRVAKEHPDVLTTALEAKDPDTLRTAVGFAQHLATPPIVARLGDLLASSDHQLRTAVVETLESVGSAEALHALERALDDPQRELRIHAIRVLSERGHRGAFAKIDALITGGGLKDADLTEKMAFFEAYGVLSGAPGISHLAPMLLPKRGFMKRKEDPETRACAAMALGKIGTPEARDLLDQARSDKEPLVRNAVNKALRAMG